MEGERETVNSRIKGRGVKLNHACSLSTNQRIGQWSIPTFPYFHSHSAQSFLHLCIHSRLIWSNWLSSTAWYHWTYEPHCCWSWFNTDKLNITASRPHSITGLIYVLLALGSSCPVGISWYFQQRLFEGNIPTNHLLIGYLLQQRVNQSLVQVHFQ